MTSGTVHAITMDVLSRKLYYQLDAPDVNLRAEMIPDDDVLCFCAGCLVKVKTDGREMDGKILVGRAASPNAERALSPRYTVMLFDRKNSSRFKVEENVPQERIDYRTDAATSEAPPNENGNQAQSFGSATSTLGKSSDEKRGPPAQDDVSDLSTENPSIEFNIKRVSHSEGSVCRNIGTTKREPATIPDASSDQKRDVKHTSHSEESPCRNIAFSGQKRALEPISYLPGDQADSQVKRKVGERCRIVIPPWLLCDRSSQKKVYGK